MTARALVRVDAPNDNRTESPDTPAPRGRRRSRVEVARVTLFLNVRAIGAIHAAQDLGHRLTCRIDGDTLIIEGEK